MLPVRNAVNPAAQDPEHRWTSAISAAEPDSPTVVKLLEQYLVSLESGSPLSRRTLLAIHPELAGQLSSRLDALDFIFNVAPQLAEGDESDVAMSSADSRPMCLGDFRLLHEIGRGGMGVVYEAEQVSLGRRVALKVLPFAAMLGENRLRRFQNEARVAASLDHPHIVAIHAVGVERGVYYYAMQLIQGQSLDRLIAELRHLSQGDTDLEAHLEDVTPEGSSATSLSEGQPQTERSTTTVADHLGLSTKKDIHATQFLSARGSHGHPGCRGLHYAHENGVLHRDIKPANLLLDFAGRLWITDFGLAHLQTDAGMTLSGDLVGTLRVHES